jgi:hypothetical protein
MFNQSAYAKSDPEPMHKTAFETYDGRGPERDKKEGAQMFGAGWAWPVLTGIGLIVILAALELMSVVIAAMGEPVETPDRSVEAKRAA